MQTTEKSVLGTSERRERIIQQLRSNGSVQVNELASHYQASFNNCVPTPHPTSAEEFVTMR